MDLRQVQYFLAVANAGSFSVAADELFISQSSLSKQILALEKELDVRLFDRSHRKIVLTEAGEFFYDHALQLETTYKVMLGGLGKYRMTKPDLAIAAIPVIAQYGITRYLAQFKSKFPNIHIVLEEKEVATILPAMKNRQYDLALVRDHDLVARQYNSVEFLQDKLVVAVSNEHRFATRKSLSLKELAGENFITYNKGSHWHEIVMNACREAGFEPRVFYASLRGASIVGLVAAKSGIALMMEQVLNYYRRPDVVSIPLDETIESRIVLVYLKNKKISKPAKTFIRFIQKVVQTA